MKLYTILSAEMGRQLFLRTREAVSTAMEEIMAILAAILSAAEVVIQPCISLRRVNLKQLI